MKSNANVYISPIAVDNAIESGLLQVPWTMILDPTIFLRKFQIVAEQTN